MEQATLTIGDVAHRAGLKPSAIRYYESAGVLPVPERRGGQRRYGPRTLEQLHVIDVAKRAGFTLAEAGVLLASADGGEPAHEQLRALAERKLSDVEALIERATAMRAWLTTATGCTCDTLDVCGLFDAGRTLEPVELRITHVGG